MHQYSTQRPPDDGPLSGISGQVRVGMALRDVVRWIRDADAGNIDAIYIRGTRVNDEAFSGLGFSALEAIPPDGEVEHAVIEVDDENGREFVITVLNGVVLETASK